MSDLCDAMSCFEEPLGVLPLLSVGKPESPCASVTDKFLWLFRRSDALCARGITDPTFSETMLSLGPCIKLSFFTAGTNMTAENDPGLETPCVSYGRLFLANKEGIAVLRLRAASFTLDETSGNDTA